MKQRLLTIVLLLLCFTGQKVLAQNPNGTCGMDGSNVTWELNLETGELIIGGEGKMGQGELLGWESPDVPWHSYSAEIKTVTIQDGVTQIAVNAFNGCYKLSKVSIPNSITDILPYAFYDCSGLTSIEIPSSVTSIGYGAFKGCTGLEEVHISDLSSWCGIHFGDEDSNPWYYAHNLYLNDELVTAELVVPDGVSEIKSYAFYGCSWLTNVTIPNSVTSIGHSAFRGCTGLESVTIPNSVTSIGYYAFYGCTGLTSIEIPNSVTSIGGNAFYGCTGLTSIEIPGSVTSIESETFNACTGLRSVVIGSGIRTIDTNAFAGCSNLTSVTISGSVSSIESKAFAGCTALYNLNIEDGDGALSLYLDTFEGCPIAYLYLGRDLNYKATASISSPFNGIKNTLTSLTLGSKITTINTYIFVGCNGLTSITIPQNVKNINRYAFQGCGIKDITIEDGDEAITIDSQAFLFCPTETVYIGRNITDGDYSPFTSIQHITVGNKVTELCDFMFYGCNITSLEIPSSVERIGIGTFSHCSELTSINIPSSVMHIDTMAFVNSGLKNLTFEDGRAYLTIKSDAFGSCPISTLYLGRNVELEPDESISPFSRYTLSSVTIGNEVGILPDYIFKRCENISEITIPESVHFIESYAFSGCTGLTSITLPDVGSIGDYAFKDCSALKEVVIGNICTISSNAFSNAPVETLYVGGRLIGKAFTGKETLKSVIFSESGSYPIENEAFRGCDGLTSVVIPSSVSSVGAYAFYNCANLTNVTIKPAVESLGERAFGLCLKFTDLVIEDSNSTLELAADVFIGDPIKNVYIGRNLEYATNSSPFMSNKTISSVSFGEKITGIGNSLFKNCSTLTEISIPDNVVTIDSDAFAGCSALSNITIAADDDTLAISETSFRGCSVDKLILGRDFISSSSENSPFEGMPSLTSIVIGDKVTGITTNAFKGCTGLTDITIPVNIRSISGNAFLNCSGLKGITITDCEDVLAIDNTSFDGCPVETLYLGRNLDDSYSSFGNHPELKEITFSKCITSISKSLFENCTGLTAVHVPQNVVGVGEKAFYNCSNLSTITFESVVPAKIFHNSFYNKTLLYVPTAAYGEYCADNVWKTYIRNITTTEYDTKAIEITAEKTTSSVLEAIGESVVTAVVDLKVDGSINSYDIIVFRDKMPALRNLDLSGATVVANNKAFFDGNCTGDDLLGNYTFNGMKNLCSIKLPSALKSIGEYAFSGCENLQSVEIPSTVESIGDYAFNDCNSLLNVTIPNEVLTIGENTFSNCRSLKKIILSHKLKHIEDRAFYQCSSLEEICFPPKLELIGSSSFEGCSSLEEIRIPSSVTSISNNAFAGCNNLNKVYTYTVEPTSISENTFSTFTTATLYVPKVSYRNYYWDDGWKRFLNLAEFDEPYEYFYVNNDYTLDDNTGYIDGADGKDPDADINAGGGLIVEGEQSDEEEPNQSLGDVNVNHDGEGNGATIIGDNNLHVDNLHIRINVKGGRWYFFAFPFDIPFEKISMENGSDYIFRYYDGDERAKGKSGWKDINENHLKAARGYIFQCSANDVLVLSIEDIRFKKEDKYNELVAHVSENLKDASWNFMGNPYLSYYDMADMDYTAPVTVWDGSKYVAMRPGDDDYHFGPYEAFFVQKPGDKENVGFNGDDKMTGKQSKEKKEKQAAARRARGVDPDRLLINITIAHNDESDRTRVVFNERQTSNYETACDAAKFSTSGVTQLYTIDSEGVHYAINERPVGNGVVAIGYTAVENGTYTIDAPRMDVPVYLVDKKNGTVHDFKDGEYSFTTEAGTYEDRFEISLAKDTTGIEGVENESDEDAEVYDLHGRRIKSAGNGVYIINGEKILVK